MSIDNFAAYDCRGRNRVIGAKLSEHGKGNALDVRSFKLANGTVVELTDPQVSKDYRLGVRKTVCARFTASAASCNSCLNGGTSARAT